MTCLINFCLAYAQKASETLDSLPRYLLLTTAYYIK
jgi:hypothetical protein